MGKDRTRRLVRARLGVAALVGTAMLLVPLGAATADASSSYRTASPSAFCKTMMSFHPTAPKQGSPTQYRAWIKQYLPYYKKLAAQAPNASVKRIFSTLVVMLTYEYNSTKVTALEQYIAAHRSQWTKDWATFSKDILSCAMSVYG
jgi:hypothetical protein